MPTYKFVDDPCEQIGFLHRALKCCHLARFNGRLWPQPPPPPPPTLPRADPPQSPGIDPRLPAAQTARGSAHKAWLGPALPAPHLGFLPTVSTFSPSLLSRPPAPFLPNDSRLPPRRLPLFPSSLSLLLSEPWQLLPMQRDAPIHSASQTL
jgi:hypothetical protein